MKASLALSLFAVFSSDALQAAPLSLIGPSRNGSEFHFTLTASSNEFYILQTSTNLINWTSILTNRESGATRSITVSTSQSRSFYRAVASRVRLRAALMANRFIQLSGDQITVDSFDSSDPNASTDGQYDLTKATDRGELAAHRGITNAGGNARLLVKGFLRIGSEGHVSLGPSDSIGDAAWVMAGRGFVQPGHLVNSMDVSFPTAPTPPAGGFAPAAGTVGGTNYNYVLGSGHYIVFSGLSMSGPQKMMVIGNASLRINGDWSMSGQSKVIIAPNASLTVYVRNNASLSGQGIANQNTADRFVVLGGPECTHVSLSGGSEFVGLIYAPHARLSLSGSSAYIGSIVCSEANLSGTFDFHFDEALKSLVF